MGFEDNLINRMDREAGHQSEDVSKVIKEAHEKVLKLFEDYQIQEESLRDTYGDEVDKDKARTREKESRPDFEKGGFLKEEAEVFEGIILQEGEMSEWFGPGVETFKASKFDDYFNGTDIILEVEEGESASHFALGVDVTFTVGDRLGEKVDRIISNIEDGKLTTVKYFHSEQFEGRLKNTPHLVIGIERKNVERLADRWLNGSRKEMADHKVQYVILEEMRMQLEVFMRYAESMNKDNLVKAYEKALRTINRIIEEKGEYDLGELADDRVFNYIKEQMAKLDEMIDSGTGMRRW